MLPFLVELAPAVNDGRFVPTPALVTHYRRGWWREPCVYCGELRPKTQMTKEHVEPVSAGGGNSWENIATACHNCNHKRGAMPLLMMLLWVSYERAGIRLTKNRRKVMGICQPPIRKPEPDLTSLLASVMMGA